MKIVTDCAADLSPEEARQHEIAVAPLFINFPDGQVNASEISADDFYRRLAAMQPNIPTTSQPSSGDIAAIYSRLLAGISEEILSIHISSGLSGTVNSARTAAKQVADKLIEVVDSLTLSGGERFQVLAAAQAAKLNWSKEQILHKLDAVRQATEVVYTLDTLSYLARGGRIGRVQALASSLLNIKPIITVDKKDGKYNTAAKARTLTKAMEEIADYLVKSYQHETDLWVSVVHGQFEEQAKALATLLQDRLQIKKLEMVRISPVLGVHTGPKIVGACVVPMRLFDELNS